MKKYKLTILSPNSGGNIHLEVEADGFRTEGESIYFFIQGGGAFAAFPARFTIVIIAE